MIYIKNTQKTYPIKTKQIHTWASKILAELGYEDFDLSIWFCAPPTIARYNEQFRNKKGPTDVLSFPFYSNLKAGQRIKAQDAEDKALGDLIIAPAIVARDAKNYDVTPEERMKLILAHGVLHLLGYDHITDTDYKIMHRHELKLVKQL